MSIIRTRNLGQKAGANHGMVIRTIGPIHNAGISVANDAQGFIADRAYRVVSIQYALTVANGAAGTCSVNKCTGTQAASAGTALIKTEASPPAGFTTGGLIDLTAAANNVRTANLVATESTLRLAVGDRIALDFGTSIATIEGLIIQVKLLPIPNALYTLTD